MNKFKSEKGVSLIALIIFLVMIIIAAGIIVVMVISTNKNESTSENTTSNTAVENVVASDVVNIAVDNEVADANSTATDENSANVLVAKDNVDYLVIKVEDTSKGELAYKEKEIKDTTIIDSLIEVVNTGVPYQEKSFIADFGDAPEIIVVHYKDGTTYSLMAADEFEDSGNKVNLIATWTSEDGSDKTLYQISSKLAEQIQKVFKEN